MQDTKPTLPSFLILQENQGSTISQSEVYILVIFLLAYISKDNPQISVPYSKKLYFQFMSVWVSVECGSAPYFPHFEIQNEGKVPSGQSFFCDNVGQFLKLLTCAVCQFYSHFVSKSKSRPSFQSEKHLKSHGNGWGYLTLQRKAASNNNNIIHHTKFGGEEAIEF